MKSVRLTSVISIAVFCLLAFQVHLTAQELQRHSFADLIQNPDEMQASSDTSTPDSLVATIVKLYPTHLSFGSIPIGNHSSAKTVTLTNVGTRSLTISAIAITGTDPAQRWQGAQSVSSKSLFLPRQWGRVRLRSASTITAAVVRKGLPSVERASRGNAVSGFKDAHRICVAAQG
jgi:hypothetical protein